MTTCEKDCKKYSKCNDPTANYYFAPDDKKNLELLKKSTCVHLSCLAFVPNDPSEEQKYHDYLKKLSADDLVEMAKQEQININNADIRLNMIRNLLINMGVEPPTVFFNYHKFM